MHPHPSGGIFQTDQFPTLPEKAAARSRTVMEFISFTDANLTRHLWLSGVIPDLYVPVLEGSISAGMLDDIGH